VGALRATSFVSDKIVIKYFLPLVAFQESSRISRCCAASAGHLASDITALLDYREFLSDPINYRQDKIRFLGKLYLRSTGSKWGGGELMADLKIRVFKDGEAKPETTVTIPCGILNVASKLIPKQAAEALHNKGIDLDEIVRLSKNPEISGTLVEIEEHKKNEKIVISLE